MSLKEDLIQMAIKDYHAFNQSKYGMEHLMDHNSYLLADKLGLKVLIETLNYHTKKLISCRDSLEKALEAFNQE